MNFYTKTNLFLLASVSALLPACSGCQDDPPQPPGAADMSADMSADMAADTGADMCVPLATCPADRCGEVDDGCGGTLDCGVCPCRDGQPVEQRCGPCGLGQLVCDADGLGGGSCSAPEVPGVDASLTPAQCAEVIRYVDYEAAAGGDGRADSPYRAVSAALGALRSGQDTNLSGEPVRLLVVRQTTEFQDVIERETLRLIDGVSIAGGFDASWRQSPDARSTLTVFPLDDNTDRVVGVEAVELSRPTSLTNLTVYVTASTNANGADIYGLYARSAQQLHLNKTWVQTGGGIAGATGSRGDFGAPGNRGSSPTPVTNPNVSVPGPAGINDQCPEANGGVGGRGSVRVSPNSTPLVAEAGQGSPQGVSGGPAGTDATPDGQDGQDAPAVAEPVGAHGQGGTHALSTVRQRWWVGAGDGEDGARGAAGAGGGGGGGAAFVDTAGQDYAGPSGAGGGSGGCGGEGGGGGQAGGTAFGLFAIDSSVTIASSTILAGPGGRGGDGGPGAEGGAGERGGSPYTLDLGDVERSGGAGGAGADGARGGDGGGGAGGNSYGVYCQGSTLSVSESDLRAADTPASGGGGPNPGAVGEVRDSVGCGL